MRARLWCALPLVLVLAVASALADEPSKKPALIARPDSFAALFHPDCSHCKTEQKVERNYLRRIGFPADEIETAKFYHGTGCEDCRQLGYQGRMGIYELLILNEGLRPLILNRAPASTIAQKAMEFGMRTLRTDGWNKVRNGQTTIEEVLKYT